MKIINLILLVCLSLNLVAQQKAPLKVKVTDFNNKPLKGEQVLFVNQKTRESIKGISNKDGSFNVELPGGAIYDIKLKSVGDAQDYNTMEVPAIAEGMQYGENEMSIMIEMPKSFTLDNVLFETGSSTLKTSSKKELDELYTFLELKPEIKIEIGGHTDNVGDDEANLELSKERARAVRSYLVEKGIAAGRVTAKGYGENFPVADNNFAAGRKQNRRTEVRIL